MKKKGEFQRLETLELNTDSFLILFQNMFEQDKACNRTVGQCALAHLPCELQRANIYITII